MHHFIIDVRPRESGVRCLGLNINIWLEFLEDFSRFQPKLSYERLWYSSLRPETMSINRYKLESLQLPLR